MKEDDLRQLVRSLSGSEKRYFHLFCNAGRDAEAANYLRLFDFIEAHPKASDEEIKLAFQGEAFLRQLPVTKNYLYHLLLDSLRAFHRHQSIGLEISERIDKIDLLFQRKMYKACMRLLHFTKKLILELELPTKLIEILKWEIRLLKITGGKTLTSLLASCHQQLRIAQKYVKLETQLTEVHDLLYQLVLKRSTLTDAELESEAQIVNLFPVTKYDPEKLMFDARIIYYYVQAYLGLVRDGVDIYLEAHRNMISTWESNHGRIRLERERYFRVLQGFLDAATVKGSDELVEEILKKAKDSAKLLRNASDYEALRLCNWELLFRLNNEDTASATLLVPKMERYLNMLGNQIEPQIALVFYGNMAIAYFIRREFRMTIPYLQRIASTPSAGLRTDVHLLGRLLGMVVDYEIGSFNTLENTLRNFQRSHRNSEPLSSMEAGLVDFFTRLLQSKSDKGAQDTFRSMLESVATFQGSVQAMLLNEISAWLQWRLGKLS